MDPARFAPFRPSKVLYDFDGPRTFTFLDSEGELFLALWFDENAETIRYLVVPFSTPLLDRLEAGQMSIRESLDQPRLWVVDVDNGGKPVRATRTTLADLPEDELPPVGTMLLPSLEPPPSLRRASTRPERSVRLVGRVRELDADFLRFELRDIEGEVTRRQCFFDEELWDDVRNLLGEEVRVEVLGVETSPTSPVRVAFMGKLAG
jgi:hypothetical protein